MAVAEKLDYVLEAARADGFRFSDPAVVIAHEAIAEVDAKYGPESPEPMAYHNAEHAVDVIRRGLRLVKILDGHVGQKWRQDLPDLVLIGGATHDIWQNLGTGINETKSADAALKKVTDYSEGAWSNLDRFSDRLRAGIMATEVKISPTDNEIIQVNLPNGKPDPLKFILAFADINGIAMDGPGQMIRDCVRLCGEIYKDQLTGQAVGEFLLRQTGFLRTRLNDRRVRADLMYYFLDGEPEVYELLKQEFESNIIAAAQHAKFIEESPAIFTDLADELMAIGRT